MANGEERSSTRAADEGNGAAVAVIGSNDGSTSTEQEHGEVVAPDNLKRAIKVLGKDPQFWVRLLPYSMLGGISFGVPAIQDDVFHLCGDSWDITLHVLSLDSPRDLSFYLYLLVLMVLA